METIKTLLCNVESNKKKEWINWVINGKNICKNSPDKKCQKWVIRRNNPWNNRS